MADYEDQNDYEDPGERMVSELEEVHYTLKEILSTLNSRTSSSGWVWIVLFIFFLEGWSGSKPDRWTDKVWYSLRYDSDSKNVTVDTRPRDCDFFHAPLGGKGCRYQKRTNVFGAEQRRVLVQQATTTEDRQIYEREPNSVSVYWEKVEE